MPRYYITICFIFQYNGTKSTKKHTKISLVLFLMLLILCNPHPGLKHHAHLVFGIHFDIIQGAEHQGIIELSQSAHAVQKFDHLPGSQSYKCIIRGFNCPLENRLIPCFPAYQLIPGTYKNPFRIFKWQADIGTDHLPRRGWAIVLFSICNHSRRRLFHSQP